MDGSETSATESSQRFRSRQYEQNDTADYFRFNLAP